MRRLKTEGGSHFGHLLRRVAVLGGVVWIFAFRHIGVLMEVGSGKEAVCSDERPLKKTRPSGEHRVDGHHTAYSSPKGVGLMRDIQLDNLSRGEYILTSGSRQETKSPHT